MLTNARLSGNIARSEAKGEAKGKADSLKWLLTRRFGACPGEP